MDDSLPFVAKELVDREVIKDGTKEQRTQVFKEEKCAMGNLCAQVLEHYSQVVSITIILETFLVVKNNRLFL